MVSVVEECNIFDEEYLKLEDEAKANYKGIWEEDISVLLEKKDDNMYQLLKHNSS